MGAFFITLREGFEAALIVGLVLAFLHQSGRDDQKKAVWAGVLAAAAMATVTGLVLFLSGASMPEASRELFESLAMLLAALLVTWMVFWMKRQASANQKAIKSHLQLAIESSSSYAIAAIVFVAVGREFLESALFLFASVSSSGAASTFWGAALGASVAIVLGWAAYKGSSRIPISQFFLLTGVLVILFSAWLVFSACSGLAEVLSAPMVESAAPAVGLAYAILFSVLYATGNSNIKTSERAEN